ncbi:MAG: hypothetical protein IPJ77_08200 [Planctomycetes bacterium]|nr:hypothetical protein [Planctomycetota bacterium]
MSSSRSRLAYVAVLCVLVFAAVEPGTLLDVWIERALVPSRFAAELARPFGWLESSSVRAAESTLAAEAPALAATSRELLARQAAGALPRDPELARGRGAVHAQVVERKTQRADCVTIQFAPEAPVEVDAPVTHGDHYVGRIDALSRERAGEATLRLVTEKSFRVGAEVEAPDGRKAALVVGGVAPRPSHGADEDERRASADAGLFLAVHAPQDRSITSGVVRVREIEAPGSARSASRPSGGLASLAGGELASLANGFRLGELVRYDVDGVVIFAVRAELDYGAEPYELAVLAPAEQAEAGPPLARDPFAVERWIRARCAVPGEASIGREARRILAGTRDGVEPGAALCVGGQLVGRVETSGPWSASARLAGDPGFRVQVAAALAGSDAPRALGELVALGRDDDDALLFVWRNAIDPPPPGAVAATPAELFTAPGERSVPAGLLLGSTVLPRTRGLHVLRVTQPADGRALGVVQVWRAAIAREEEPEEDEP